MRERSVTLQSLISWSKIDSFGELSKVKWLSDYSWNRWCLLSVYHHLNKKDSPLPVKMSPCWLAQTDSCFDLFHILWMFCWWAWLVFNSYVEDEWLVIYDVCFSFKFAIWEINCQRSTKYKYWLEPVVYFPLVT